jgi:hypothetical protein
MIGYASALLTGVLLVHLALDGGPLWAMILLTIIGFFPRGALVRYREWYGCQPDKPNTGLRLTAEEVAQGILARESEPVKYSVLDPAAFAEDGGPSIAERMNTILRKSGFHRADNKRVTERGAMGGWDQMRSRLVGDADGRPMLYVFSRHA